MKVKVRNNQTAKMILYCGMQAIPVIGEVNEWVEVEVPFMPTSTIPDCEVEECSRSGRHEPDCGNREVLEEVK